MCNSLNETYAAVMRVITEGTPNLDWRGFIRLLAWGKLKTRVFDSSTTALSVQSLRILAHRNEKSRLVPKVPLGRGVLALSQT